MSKRKPKQSFCYAPTEGSGCIFYMRFFSRILSREWRRRKHAGIIHIPGCIYRFALGFCKNIKKRTETLYQSFSPFMWNDSKTNTIPGYRFAIALSFYIGCIWVQNGCSRVQTEARWVQHRAFVLLFANIFSCFARRLVHNFVKSDQRSYQSLP